MISMSDIVLQAVEEITGISKEIVIGRSRQADVVDARFIAVYYCHKQGMSSMAIASLFGIARYSVNRIVSEYYSRRTQQFYVWDDAVDKHLNSTKIAPNY